ncbi:MAG: Gfo/Idh/MocA family oxidoreductase, partial [Desulfobacterales bacterium]
ADIHCDAYSRNDQAEVVAVADIADAGELINKWHIADYYSDYNEMFKRGDIDLISVCVPNFLHHDVAIAAAEAGKHVVVEKPLSTTAEDARELVAVCNQNGVKLMYAEDWCFSPALKRAEEIINEGAIGEVLFIKAKEVHNGTHSPYAKDKEMCGGGSFMHLGIHPIGWLLYLLGKGNNPVVEVSGKMTGGLAENYVHKDNGGEDFGMGMMRFKNGEFAFVEGNYITVGGMDDKVEIYGTEGLIKVDLTFGSPILCYSRPGISYSIEKTDHNLGWTRPAVDEFLNLGYVPEMKHFVDCVLGTAEPFYGVDGRAGVACVELVKAFYESNESGKTVYGEWI